MSEKKITDDKYASAQRSDSSDLASIVQDESTIPGGEVDPVYEKKAKVLNRAVRAHESPSLYMTWPC